MTTSGKHTPSELFDCERMFVIYKVNVIMCLYYIVYLYVLYVNIIIISLTDFIACLIPKLNMLNQKRSLALHFFKF